MFIIYLVLGHNLAGRNGIAAAAAVLNDAARGSHPAGSGSSKGDLASVRGPRNALKE